VTERDDMQRRVRRNALGLGLLAVAIYLGYYLLQLSRMAG
jgi:hypothetical protein